MHKHGQQIKTGYLDSLSETEASEQPALAKFAGSLTGMAGGTIRGGDREPSEARQPDVAKLSQIECETRGCDRKCLVKVTGNHVVLAEGWTVVPGRVCSYVLVALCPVCSERRPQ